ncbi:41088_t:CDS:2 [Gigaspora margarita]|uniref:41088_t:CDS:1 n=1 Tax=Gigaspora margarita TaxID=4874 RepID=A0ABN7WDI2_GIGMA|nr:41088_t:CDS:2 [Gigaspora margarita]
MDTMTSIIKVTAKIISSYVPIVATIKILVEEIYKIYVNVEYNKELCLIMMDQVKTAEFALEQMMLRSKENEEYFYEKEYSLLLKKFINILKDIKNFVEKQTYKKLTQEFDTCMKKLHFTIAIANENQKAKDAQKVDQAIEICNNLELTWFKMSIFNNKLDRLAQCISIIMTKMNIQLGDVPNINENNLKKPPVGLHKKDSVIRKYYNSIEVAYKPIKDSSQNKVELAILGKLSLSKYSQLLENNKLDFGITCNTENSKLPKFEDEPINFYENNSLIDSLISVDEGIEFHCNKNYKSAWKCFVENSKLCNSLAQYWQAYYLYYRYFVKQDKEPVADMQYRYTVSLINNFGNDLNFNDEKCNKILHYLKLASNNKNNKAAYQLGNIYMNRALKIQQNKELGLIYLELAS